MIEHLRRSDDCRPILALVKFRVAAAATISALSGLAASAGGSGAAAPLAAGVFLLACGACCLNEWQERRTDGLMLRTQGRPIPSGSMAPSSALILAAGLLAAGAMALFMAGGGRATLLGLAAAAWYNGVYTPLKRVTAFAVVPGALVGAVPPALGWLAGGGELSDPRIQSICLFFYLGRSAFGCRPGARSGPQPAGLPARAGLTLARRTAGIGLMAAAAHGTSLCSGPSVRPRSSCPWPAACLSPEGRRLLSTRARALRRASSKSMPTLCW